MSWIRDICFFAGSAIIVYGVYLVYPPAAVILAGVMLVYLAYIWMQVEQGKR